jgi:FkbM family methyltransferase
MSEPSTMSDAQARDNRTRDAADDGSNVGQRFAGLEFLEVRHGIGRDWAWPRYDDILWATMEREHMHADVLRDITMENRRRRGMEGTAMVLQAGGACGVMPWKLSREPGMAVVSFEPNRLNHACATINLAGTRNAWCIHGALGGMSGWTGMRQDQAANAGAWSLADTREQSAPVFDVRDRPDRWSLVWLDMEGTEFAVVSGLLENLARDKPVVALELKGAAARYGWEDEWTISLLEGYGYEIAQWLGNDAVFVWQD